MNEMASVSLPLMMLMVLLPLLWHSFSENELPMMNVHYYHYL
jgi:hypothetical protein